MAKREPTARLTVIKNGHELWNFYKIRSGTLATLEFDAEWWIYDNGAAYARIDIWDEGLNDWGVYKEYTKENR